MNISYNKDVGGIIIDNLLQYLTWRGDISFKERAFNEIDALACAMIGYIEWDHIVDQTSVTLHEACLKNKQIHSHQELLETYAYSPSLVDFIKIIPQVSRYQDVKLKKYISVLDEDKGSQFAAITIELPDNKLFISFRGTDRTILGWKEDFEMAFLDMIPSQQMAVDYLKHAYDDVIEEKRILGFKYSQKVAQLYIGGHSKGGNLAMYAAICCNEMKEHIQHVYSFDGPGFKEEFYSQHDYQSIMSRITNYVPISSLIGRLMIHKENYIIFNGYDKGLQQHDAFYWKIQTDHFDYVSHFDEESEKTMSYINDVLLSKTDEEKKNFISLIFQILSDIKISHITDFNEISMIQMVKGLKELSSMSIEDSKIFFEFLKLVYLQIKSVYFTKKKEL